MLYEFHRTQNARKPGSVHASYLICGARKTVETHSQTNGTQSQNEEDSFMQGSSFISSSMPEQETESDAIHVLSITLVKEEDLEGRFVLATSDEYFFEHLR